MTEINNSVEQLKTEIELIRDILGIFLNKSQIHSSKNLLMKLYGVHDLGKMIARLNHTYNELNLE
jgi:hypothetical protein